MISDRYTAAQTWCAFRFACIMLNVNVKNDVFAAKKSNNLVVGTNNKIPFSHFM